MLKIGADPEFFLRHTKSGEYISAHDLVPGTKAEPHRLTKGALQADGTAVEFNIDPVTTAEDFQSNVSSVLAEIREMVDPSLEFCFQPVVYYPNAYFNSLPPTAKELGCDPDFSAYSGQANVIAPLIHPTHTMRTGAGHIHMGWTEGVDVLDDVHREDCRVMAEFLDGTVQKVFNMLTPENERSQLYGAAGAFRVKSYGMEFRSPSNYWLNEPELYPMVFHLFEKAYKAATLGGGMNSLYSFDDNIRSLRYMTSSRSFGVPLDVVRKVRNNASTIRYNP